MQTLWFQDLHKDKQEEFKKIVLGSEKVLDKLSKICYNKIIELEKVTIEAYDSPSWSHKQAHLNGRREALKDIMKLVTLDTN